VQGDRFSGRVVDGTWTTGMEPKTFHERTRMTDRRRSARVDARSETTQPARDRYRAVVDERLAEMVKAFALSPRERQVLELLLYGRTADEIGKKLGVSARTVKFHQTNVLDKLDADSRLDLFRLFFQPD